MDKNEQLTKTEQWVSLSDAAFHLKKEGMKVSLSKLSRMAQAGTIKVEADPIDKRLRLVELNALRQFFGSSKRFISKAAGPPNERPEKL